MLSIPQTPTWASFLVPPTHTILVSSTLTLESWGHPSQSWEFLPDSPPCLGWHLLVPLHMQLSEQGLPSPAPQGEEPHSSFQTFDFSSQEQRKSLYPLWGCSALFTVLWRHFPLPGIPTAPMLVAPPGWDPGPKQASHLLDELNCINLLSSPCRFPHYKKEAPCVPDEGTKLKDRDLSDQH
jgi:hypothetical protein